MGTPGDPLERMNRATYRFNNGFDRAVLRPVARGYRDHVPQVVQKGIDNFLTVIDTERTLAGLEAQLAQSDATVTTYQIDLFRALGGGWR